MEANANAMIKGLQKQLGPQNAKQNVNFFFF